MNTKRWIGLAAVLALVGNVQAAELVYEGFEYDVTSGGINTATLNGGIGLSGSWSSSDGADPNFNITAGSYSIGVLTVSSNKLKRTATGGVEAIQRTISTNLPSGGFWFSIIHNASANSQFAIGTSGFADGSSGKGALGGTGYGFTHFSGNLKACIWSGGLQEGGALAVANGTTQLLVGHVQRNVGGNDTIDLYEVDASLAQPASPVSTKTIAAAAGTLNTLTMSSNRGPGFDEIRIGATYADVVPTASEFSFNLSPEAQQDIQADYPAVVATNSIAAEYANSAAGVEITVLNVTGDSNAFSAVTSTPFTMTDPVPSNEVLEFAFDASAVKAITGATEAFNATGSVDVVWKNLDDNVLVTNTVELIGKFRNPPVSFNIDSSLSMTLEAPATVVSNDISVSYVPGRPGYTNVEIVAVNVLNESNEGSFSAINPGVIQDPEPSNDVITVIFDNTVAGLGNKEGATADIEVIWGEVGSSTTSTSTVPVSAYNYDLASGVIQQVFGNPVELQLGVGSGTLPMNNFEVFTNKWNANQNLTQDLSTGSLKLTSGGNTRSAYNLVEANTAGSDNFGAVDTHILTNGLYRYDFDYEVLNTDGDNVIWSFNAYALVNQQTFSTNNNSDKVLLDVATGTSGGIDVDIQNSGNAYYTQHPNGTLGGTNNVGRSSGSLFLNVQDGEDALFVMHRSGKCTVRLYDLVLTRIGDYDPNTDANDPNAVLAAKFNDIAATNSIITALGQTDTNTNGVNNTWRGNNVYWNSQLFRSDANTTAAKATAVIVWSGTAGYDDVGVQDTIPLSQGAYDLTLDVDVVGGFPSNDSIAKVEFYALSQDPTGNVNQVRINHTPGDGAYLVADGAAGYTLLGSQEYTTNTTETLSLTNMTVLDGQDIAIVFYHRHGPDMKIDNVELVRTGDAVLSGYDGWTQQFDDFYDTDLESDPDGDAINNLLEYALNGDPTISDTSILPESFTGLEGGTNWLYYVHTERTDDGSLAYTVEAGNNLVYTNWSTAGIDYVDETVPDNNYKSVTNRTDVDLSAEFIRLQVQKD